MELFDYQKKAVEFIAKKKKVYLALDLGMGKTIASLEVVAKEAKKNILLIAEKNEIVNSRNFEKEVNNYFLPNLSYVNLRDDDLPKGDGRYETRFVCGINPDGIIKHSEETIRESFDSVIIDEATLAKTTTTKRFKKVHKIVKGMDYVSLLSGMPMMNGAAELYAPLLLLDNPMVAGKKNEGKKAFDTVFAGGHFKKIRNTGVWFKDYVWWNKGADNVRELRWLIRDSFFFMQKGETDIFKKKTRTTKPILMGCEWLAEYNKAWEDYLDKAKKRDVNMKNVVDLRKLIENGQCYQVNSRYKAQQVACDIAQGKYGDKRIVVFSMFIETDKLLQEELERRFVSFRPYSEVQEWKAGTEQVLVGRIKAHGKGGNLPEASVALFVDMDFVPANNIQAENRIDRPEQKEDMQIIYYVADGKETIDQHVLDINRNKMSKIDKFMKHLTPEELETMPERIEALKLKFPKETKILEI